MAWSSTWPDGAQSVKTNQATGAANTTYVKTTMNVDHYWDSSGDNDGHHQWVQMTQSGTAAVPVDITLGTGMEGGFYSKAKSSAESPDNQDVQPFFIDNKVVGVPGTTQVMQLLGMRAFCCFDVSPTFVITIKYSHNITSITRDGVGQYHAIFPNTFPSVNYLAQGCGVRTSSTAKHGVIFQVRTPPTASLATVKTTSRLDFTFIRPDDNLTDVVQGWFYCFGG